MAYHFEVDSCNRIARCRFTGLVTDEELKECYGVATEIMAANDPHAAVADFSEVTSVKVSARTIRDLASSPPVIANPDRARVIVAKPLHIFGLARMFGFLGQFTRPNLHVVRFEEEAWAILGVRKPQFKPFKT